MTTLLLAIWALFRRSCWLDVRRQVGAFEMLENGLQVQGWPVNEPGWKREILRTTVNDDTDTPLLDENVLACDDGQDEWEQF